jgi:hypothetical protein
LWNAFTLAAVGVPEILLFADVGASLDLADLALAAFGIELLVRLGAVICSQRAVANASHWVPHVVLGASLSHVFALACNWVEELAGWAILWPQNFRARLYVEDVNLWVGRSNVRADTSALVSIPVTRVAGISVGIAWTVWLAQARARFNVEVFSFAAKARVVSASAFAT